MSEGLKIIGSVVIFSVILVVLAFGIIKFATKMATKTGHFVIIPETSLPFNVKQVTFMSNNAVTYIKEDGTGGRISGNFRVEDAPTTIERK